MTEQQYQEYQRKKRELDPIKDFLFWCGKRRRKCLGEYDVKIIVNKLIFGMIGHGAISSKNFVMPNELRDRVIEVVGQYVDEKELELQNI